ncbi:MAG TPA: peptide chain release factor N(5)-glutamine methyltransferase [Burkholderiaceae bacterium]
MNVGAALALAQARGLERLDAQLLLAELLGCNRAWLITHADQMLSDEVSARLLDWLGQRLDQVPLAYLSGHKEFHGLRLAVDAHTLVPRPDTEVLVDWALELLPGWPAPQAVDLGTGSGAIALACKARHPAVSMTMTDFSAPALAVAVANAQSLGLAVEALQGSWFTPLAGRQFDLILGNPPYIAGDDPHLPALRHEPLSALTPGGDGLDALRAIVAGAPQHLRPGGWLLLEHGFDQQEAVTALLAAAGFEAIAGRRDHGNQPRASGARWGSAGR